MFCVMSLCFETKHTILRIFFKKFSLPKVYFKCEWNTLLSVGSSSGGKVCGVE